MLDKGRFLTRLGKKVTVNLQNETLTGILRDVDFEFLILEVEHDDFENLDDEHKEDRVTETVYIAADQIVTMRFRPDK